MLTLDRSRDPTEALRCVRPRSFGAGRPFSPAHGLGGAPAASSYRRPTSVRRPLTPFYSRRWLAPHPRQPPPLTQDGHHRPPSPSHRAARPAAAGPAHGWGKPGRHVGGGAVTIETFRIKMWEKNFLVKIENSGYAYKEKYQ
jgi:hypothetical protein